jgi:hypothetical protein
MATVANFRLYYPLKTNSADGQALTQQTSDGGGTVRTIISSGLTQADNYWNGAVGFFDAATATAALRNRFFHVKDFDAASDTLTLFADLPAVPGATDTFRLVLGGNWRTTWPVPGLTAGAPTNVTGVSITHAAYKNGTGNGTLAFTASGQTLKWTAPGDAAGAAVAVGAGGTFNLFSDTDSMWIEVSVTPGSLPGTNQSDTIALSQPSGIFLPNEEGDETNLGKTRYHALPFRNNHATDSLFDLLAYLVKEVSTAADTTTTSTLIDGGGGNATLTCASLTNWPASGWIYNVDKNDARYYYNLSGLSMRILDPGAGVRGKTSVAWDNGDDVQLWPDIDIGKGTVAAGQFENPADEVTTPSGVTFTTPTSSGAGLSWGDFSAVTVGVLWIREVIPVGTRAKASVLSQIQFQFDASGA